MNGTTNTNIEEIRRRRLANARLYVLTDGDADLDRFANRIRLLARADVDVIQLRDKRLSKTELCGRIETALDLLSNQEAPPLFIVNDTPALAARFNVDGVHVGQDDLDPIKARSEIGHEKLLGVSTHSLEQVTKAIANGADYLGAGPTFPSTTKSFTDFPGLEFLKQIAQHLAIQPESHSHSQIPVFAIGGIHAQNVDEVLATGFTRVAVSNAVVGANDILHAVQELNAKLR